jgi:hypothetical protein
LICLESFNGIDSLEGSDKVRKLVGGIETKAIIEFVMKHPGTNSDKIVKELQEKHISSRITTLSALEALLKLGIIEDERMGRYSRKLKYNKNFDWHNFVKDLLRSSIHEVFYDYQEFRKGLFEENETDKLVGELLRGIDKYRKIPAPTDREIKKRMKQDLIENTKYI